jgi:hypothetical protein
MTDTPLFDYAANLGKTYSPARDGKRLAGLLQRVHDYMADGQWHTLGEVQQACGGTEASCSARLRELRRQDHGGHTVERRHISNGLWEYRLKDA